MSIATLDTETRIDKAPTNGSREIKPKAPQNQEGGYRHKNKLSEEEDSVFHRVKWEFNGDDGKYLSSVTTIYRRTEKDGTTKVIKDGFGQLHYLKDNRYYKILSDGTVQTTFLPGSRDKGAKIKEAFAKNDCDQFHGTASETLYPDKIKQFAYTYRKVEDNKRISPYARETPEESYKSTVIKNLLEVIKTIGSNMSENQIAKFREITQLNESNAKAAMGAEAATGQTINKLKKAIDLDILNE